MHLQLSLQLDDAYYRWVDHDPLIETINEYVKHNTNMC